MPVQELMYIRENADFEKNTSLAVAINCAPVLKGSKAANIMTVSLREFNQIKENISGTDISYYLLRGKHDKFILYLYRENLLMKYLRRTDVKKFLAEYGYNTEKLFVMLVRLSIRAKEFFNGDGEFPHEIGAFLEYPIDDIRGFLENNGENCLLSGYWKVYRNVENTKKLFKKFDEERESSIKEIMYGKTLREIAV